GDVDVPVAEMIAEDVTNFGLNLVQKMNTEYRKTLLISPASLASVLSMLMLGAKGQSFKELSSLFSIKDPVKLHEQFGLLLIDAQIPYMEETSEVRKVLQWIGDSLQISSHAYPTEPIEHQEVHIANGFFVQNNYSINIDYRQAIRQVYNSDIFPIDFATDPKLSRELINEWITAKTKRKITQIVGKDTVNRSTRTILASAMFFKARWEIDFFGGQTGNRNFYPNGTGQLPILSVPTMLGIGAYPYYKDTTLDCEIFGIPYHGKMTTMYIIKPHQSTVSRLADLHKHLHAYVIDEMISKMRRVSAMVHMPKMHVTGSDRLRDELETMGIKSIFNDDNYDLSLVVAGNSSKQLYQSDAVGNLRNLETQRQQADSKDNRRSDLFVSEIVQKLDFSVHEQGTESTTAAAGIMLKSGPPMTFVVDTPFILLVRNDVTRLPLFYGIINEPPVAD
ncbi:hypothetical protein KR044_006062, partial [Drosophila immigrans]